MKRIYIILISLFIIQACSSDDDAGLLQDELVINLSEGSLGEAITPFEVGDGNWGLNIKAELEGEIKLQIDTDQPWDIALNNLKGGQDAWFLPDTINGIGESSVTIALQSNSKRESRSTSLAVRTKGAIPITKKITVLQYGIGFLDVDWDKEFLESEATDDTIINRLALDAAAYPETRIGTFDTKSDSIVAVSSEDWVKIKTKDGEIIMDLEENKDYDDARSAILSLKDPVEGLSQSIKLEQAPRERGTLKVNWNEQYLKVEEDSTLSFASKAQSKVVIGAYETNSDTIIKAESSEDWASLIIEDEKIVLDLEKNESYEDSRSALLTITNPDGGVSRTIKLIQSNREAGTLKVDWAEKYILTDVGDNDTFVFSSKERSGIQIAEFEADDNKTVEVASSESWAQIEIDEDKVLLTFDEYTGTGSRSATLTITNTDAPDGGVQESFDIVQYGANSIIDKNQWSIEPGNNHTTALGSAPFSNIIDGDPNTHWEWDWPNGDTSNFPDTPYEFDINFSESQVFNTVKLWQTQTAKNGYVKDVQFMVSSDGSDWKDLGVYRMADDQDDAEANYQDPYVYELPATYNVRYFKLVILSNVGGSKVNVGENAFMGELDVSFE